MKYAVNANDVALGIYEAEDAQGARDAAAQDAGYESESAMERRLDGPSDLIAVPMNNIETTIGTLARFYGVEIPDGIDADDAITLSRSIFDPDEWVTNHETLGEDWAPRDEAQAAEIAAI